MDEGSCAGRPRRRQHHQGGQLSYVAFIITSIMSSITEISTLVPVTENHHHCDQNIYTHQSILQKRLPRLFRSSHFRLLLRQCSIRRSFSIAPPSSQLSSSWHSLPGNVKSENTDVSLSPLLLKPGSYF